MAIWRYYCLQTITGGGSVINGGGVWFTSETWSTLGDRSPMGVWFASETWSTLGDRSPMG